MTEQNGSHVAFLVGFLPAVEADIDATTLEASAAMRTIVLRDTGERYEEFLTGLARASGMVTREELARLYRKRKKRTSNKDWMSPTDADARITKMKDGRTHLAHKAEHAVDLDTGAVVAVTLQEADKGDTTTVDVTLYQAGEAVAELAVREAKQHPDDKPKVNAKGIEEVVADKGYHSGAALERIQSYKVRTYCYLPLYIFAGDQLLCARLRPANQDAAAGSLEEVKRIVAQLRQRWPEVKIILRADSGFCREQLMGLCECHRVDYVFGLARNQRLRRIIGKPMHQAKQLHQATGKAARIFAEFPYQTRNSWSRPRRVVAKAEYLDKGENPRFVVTSLNNKAWTAQDLYEKFYCARGEMENRIKEQMHLFADRLSTDEMRGNQLRLYFSALAYTLVEALRRLTLKATRWAQAQVDTIRLRLFKIGAVVRISVRRILLQMSSTYTWKDIYTHAFHALRC